MKGLTVAGALALLFVAAPAQARNCHNPVSQNDMNACAEDDYRRADAILNQVYGGVVKDLDDHSRDLLKASQRAWIKFRDAECAYVNAANEGGSIYPLVNFGCLTDMTKERTAQLRKGQN